MPSGELMRRAGTDGLSPLGMAGQAAHFTLSEPGRDSAIPAPTSVTLFDQGLLQVLEGSATRLDPGRPYVLALSDRADGGGTLEPLSSTMANSAGAAIVNAIEPIRQLVRDGPAPRRYRVIAPEIPGQLGPAIQVMSSGKP